MTMALDSVEAVIDTNPSVSFSAKDLSAALLAGRLGAGFLLLLTDVDGVERDSGTRPPGSVRPHWES
jgi:carbamate kinase